MAKRISRESQGTALDSILNVYDYRINDKHRIEKELQHAVNNLISCDVPTISTNTHDENKMSKREWERSIQTIKRLHRDVATISNNLSHAFGEDICYIKKDKWTKINVLIDVFNDYITYTNPLWQLKYKELV